MHREQAILVDIPFSVYQGCEVAVTELGLPLDVVIDSALQVGLIELFYLRADLYGFSREEFLDSFVELRRQLRVELHEAIVSSRAATS